MPMGSGMKPILFHQFALTRTRPLSAAALSKARVALVSLLAPLELSAEALDPRRRPALGGRLFRECATAVQDVARGLRDQPALFPDIPINGAALAAAQDDADAAEVLWRSLSHHAALAYDAYLSRQAVCVDTARAVVRQVLADSAGPLRAALPHVQRIEALGQAVPLLQKRAQAGGLAAARARRAQAADVISEADDAPETSR